MLKKTITYETFDEEEITEDFYFNLSTPELIEMATEYAGGFEAMVQRIIAEKDNHKLIMRFKELILRAYGIKSDDGREFIKSEEISRRFSQTRAYESVFMMITEEDGETAMADFMIGILPRDMQRQAKAELAKTTPPMASVPSTPKPAPTKRTGGSTGAKK